MDFLCGDERFEVGKVEFPRSSSTETLLPLGTYLCFLGDECRIRGCDAKSSNSSENWIWFISHWPHEFGYVYR